MFSCGLSQTEEEEKCPYSSTSQQSMSNGACRVSFIVHHDMSNVRNSLPPKAGF